MKKNVVVNLGYQTSPLNRSNGIDGIMKSRSLRWPGHVVRVGKPEMHTEFWWWNCLWFCIVSWKILRPFPEILIFIWYATVHAWIFLVLASHWFP